MGPGDEAMEYYCVEDFQFVLSFTCIVALCVWRKLRLYPGSLAHSQAPQLWNANMEVVQAYVYIFLFWSASEGAWERGYEFLPYAYPVYYTFMHHFSSIPAVTYFLLDLDHSGVCLLYVAVSLIPRPFNVVWE